MNRYTTMNLYQNKYGSFKQRVSSLLEFGITNQMIKKNKHVLTKQNKIKIKAFLKLRKLASETLIFGKNENTIY